MGRVFGGEHQPCGTKPASNVVKNSAVSFTFNRLSHRPQGDVALFGRLNQGCRDRVNGVAELFEDRKISALRVGEVADSSFVNPAGT